MLVSSPKGTCTTSKCDSELNLLNDCQKLFSFSILRGKRDGLSKEGSGRVAIYKTIGLIKCYTLEGNYNSGKYVNILPPRGKEANTKRVGTIAPKYTPVAFEEVGRALGPSILDLTDSNPMSRIRNSEFRSLQGLRNSLRNDIERNALRAESAPKVNSHSE